ncbi:hypothetical protein Q4491_02020 [Photobacterium sp. 2_MG-2023]|uniref:Lipoprotein n=1 Tax=Photobacterium arenosum TaxID=2774143 RepID=A0ABR9BT70_9GAMM|nr:MULTISPECIES: hypothetical protein [Photobacterium]MBD8514942.1 hypothetical protein [Photobacterium arenosum]MDO6580107.1 hypothetical protein [Photobacterium sp. 2_MG-2023]
MKKHFRHKTLVFFCAFILSGCANLSGHSLFSHYSASTKSSRHALYQGQIQGALDSLPDEPAGAILDGMERGRLTLLTGDYTASFAALQKSDNAVKEQQDAARIQVSEGLNQAGSLFTNDNMISYQASDYELGFLHLYLALNYIHNRDLNGALVEMRRANQVQEAARQQRESELASAENQLQKEGLTDNIGSVLARYPNAGQTLAAVQNGYLFYLSGMLYEADGNLNDAYIDFKRALAVAPDNPYVAEAVQRLAERLSMKDDQQLLAKKYGPWQSPQSGTGRLIILDEQGVVQAPEGWRLPLWLYDSQGQSVLYNLALPHYPPRPAVLPGKLSLNNRLLTAPPLVNVDQMAKQSLSETLPVRVLRQSLRVIAKEQVRQSAARNGDEVGNVLANIFNTLTEQPDTRSWQTLPARVALYQEDLPPGSHQIQWQGRSVDAEVKSGRTTMVWISRQGQSMSGWSVLLGGN